MYHICISYAVQDILRYIQLRAIQIRRCNNNLHIVVYEARLLYPDVNLTMPLTLNSSRDEMTTGSGRNYIWMAVYYCSFIY